MVFINKYIGGLLLILTIGSIYASDIDKKIADLEVQINTVNHNIDIWREKVNPIKEQLIQKEAFSTKLNADIINKKEELTRLEDLKKAPITSVSQLEKKFKIDLEKTRGQLNKIKNILGNKYDQLIEPYKKDYRIHVEEEGVQRNLPLDVEDIFGQPQKIAVEKEVPSQEEVDAELKRRRDEEFEEFTKAMRQDVEEITGTQEKPPSDFGGNPLDVLFGDFGK